MFALWYPVDDGEWENESSEEYSSGADTANMVANSAAAINVILCSFIMTLELWGLTFLLKCMPHLVGLQRNKVLYTTYHEHNQPDIVSIWECVQERGGGAGNKTETVLCCVSDTQENISWFFLNLLFSCLAFPKWCVLTKTGHSIAHLIIPTSCIQRLSQQ